MRHAKIPDPRPQREAPEPNQTSANPQLSSTPEKIIILLGPPREA